ncbi:MAG TPA: antitoxin [Streptosporangiaceae bacterium]|nr:antitoxin [Streptosporangiaceae bacterium]
MPDFFEQAKKLASEHQDLVDTGLDKANDLVSEKTGGKYDQHIDTAEEKLEGFLGVDPGNGNE